MNAGRGHLTLLLGPESVLTLLTAAVFWFCARHNSGEGRDLAIMEKLVMLLPFLVAPAVFVTVLVPGAKNWMWLGRAVVLTYIMLGICAWRIIEGFGTGAKGQDAAFILVIVFGTAVIALGTSICGAMILAQVKPAFGEWFRARRFLGSILTLVSAVPIGFALGLVVTLGAGFVGGAYFSFKRWSACCRSFESIPAC